MYPKKEMMASTSMEVTIETTDMEKILDIKKKMFQLAMKNQWGQIVNIYKENKSARSTKITRIGDTALHIAVSEGQERHVEQLVKLMSEEELAMQNETGNTPLHMAATLGNVRMCELIAEGCPSLVRVLNKENESPLFLAALYGKKDAFLRLHYISICSRTLDCPSKRYTYCRRKDGDTILHCAIAGDYFDLAFQIINLYEDLVNYVNEEGTSPLHLLATKPSAFRSGSHLGQTEKIIYHCIYVDGLKVERLDRLNQRMIKTSEEEKNPRYPKNYQSCVNFITLLWKMIRSAYLGGGKPEDTENPGEPNSIPLTKGNIEEGGSQSIDEAEEHQSFPDNYENCFEFGKFLTKAMLIVLGLGSRKIRKIKDKKQKHTWSVQIMTELVRRTIMYEYEYEDSGMNPQGAETSQKDNEEETRPYAIGEFGRVDVALESVERSSKDNQLVDINYTISKGKTRAETEAADNKTPPPPMATATKAMAIKRDTPILIAAKNGVVEMVEKILQQFPVAIHDVDAERKNVVLLAVENRQPHVYQMLLNRSVLRDRVFRKVDHQENSALHLASKLGEHKPWVIPGAALQMQWEIKWYEFVKSSMPLHFFNSHNKEGKTAKEVFTETHIGIVKDGGEWLTNTSESCSVVAALIATVAFATSTTVPGGTKESSGTPNLENQPAFDIFAIASLIALCFSVTAMVMFLAILTSRHQEKDFSKSLPRKLLVGLTSLFVSIASMLVSFCAGHFFVLKDKLKYAAFPVYGITCLPVTLFAMAQFPLYVDLVWATFKRVPQRSYKVAPL